MSAQTSERRADGACPDLAPQLAAKIEAARSMQFEAARLAHASAASWRTIAREAAAAGCSLRDVADLLGVSPARARDLLS